jgi:branched-chain amino acid transport system permease protein
MSVVIQDLLSGVATGCTFALVATGFVVIYRVSRVVNFAQGIFAVLAGMAAESFLAHGIPHPLGEILGVLAGAVAGGGVGLAAVGRRNTPPLASLIITLGLATGAYALLILIWGDQPVSYAGMAGSTHAGPIRIQNQFLLVIGVTVLTFAALAGFFGRTYVGKALTACSSNPHAARLVGIDVRAMSLVAFVLGGALGGLAGVLLTPIQPVSFDSDVDLAINGFAAAVFGGIVSPGLALVGALVLGIAEAIVAGYFISSFQTGVALILLLALMVWQATRRRTTEQEGA